MIRLHPLFFIFQGLLAHAAEVVTYDDHVLPVFQQACLNCHNPDKTKGGLDLSSYTAAMKGGSGGKIAEPGDTGSTLIHVVKHTAEPKMPPEGDKLGADQINILVKWIEGGLLENKTSTARKASKPKFAAPVGTDPAAKPDGPPPMPSHLLLDPVLVTPQASAVHSIASSPWAPLIAITGQKQVLLHHAQTLELEGILPFPEGDPVSLAFTPDGRYLIVGGGVPGKSGVTVTFDITQGSRLLATGREFDSILAADIRPGFDIVCTGGPSRLLKLWNTETGEALQSIKKHTDWITALDISPDGVLVASGDRNGGVWVWESESGNEFHTLRAHQAAITGVVFRSDSNLLATSSEDGTIRFWEMNGGSEVRKIDAHPGGVSAFAFARDGTSASAGRDMKLKLWKPDFSHARDLSQSLPALPTCVAIDHDAKRVFVGDASGQIQVFDAADGKPAGTIPSNPPLIETRLASLSSKLSEAEKFAEATRLEAGAAVAKLEAARKSLAEAESGLHRVIEARKQAEAALAGKDDEILKKAAEAAAAVIPPAEKAVQDQKGLIPALEKSVAESESKHKSAEGSLRPLRTAIAKWSAAAINTKALRAKANAETHFGQLEQIQAEFSETARQVAQQAERLNEKRAEWHRMKQRAEDHTLSQGHLDEIQFTLSAIEASIQTQTAICKELEIKLEGLSKAIDPEAGAFWTFKAEEQSQRAAYLKAAEAL